MAKKIVCTPGICGGAPRLNDTRLTCANIVDFLNSQGSLLFFLSHHPQLTNEDVKEAVRYCASSGCIEDKPTNYCQGCSRDHRKDDPADSLIGDSEDVASIDFWISAEKLRKALEA